MKQINNWVHAEEYGRSLLEGQLVVLQTVSKLLGEYYKPGMKILDAGCDSGVYAESCLMIDDDVDYTGVDITENYINMAKEKYNENLKFFVGDVMDLDFPDDQFDLTFCFSVLQHLPGFEQALDEMIRVTREVIIVKADFGPETIIKKVKGGLMDEGYEDLEFYGNIYSIDEFKAHALKSGKFDDVNMIEHRDKLMSVCSAGGDIPPEVLKMIENHATKNQQWDEIALTDDKSKIFIIRRY